MTSHVWGIRKISEKSRQIVLPMSKWGDLELFVFDVGGFLDASATHSDSFSDICSHSLEGVDDGDGCGTYCIGMC